jgi:hypothetical protein
MLWNAAKSYSGRKRMQRKPNRKIKRERKRKLGIVLRPIHIGKIR